MKSNSEIEIRKKERRVILFIWALFHVIETSEQFDKLKIGVFFLVAQRASGNTVNFSPNSDFVTGAFHRQRTGRKKNNIVKNSERSISALFRNNQLLPLRFRIGFSFPGMFSSPLLFDPLSFQHCSFEF